MIRVVVLGCGTSAGVPQIGCSCAVCRSEDPRDKRLRCAILIEAEGRRILVDTGPDLRLQCLQAGIDSLDALLYTHAHADHLHGIDDLRQLNNLMGRAIPTYTHPDVFAKIRARFPYVFEGGRESYGYWRPELEAHPVSEGWFRAAGLEILMFRQKHGRGVSFGFRIGDFAYSTDCDGLDEAAFDALIGVKVWLVDALRERPHPSHAHLARTLEWIDRVRPREAYLTHMNHEVSYRGWYDRLPRGIEPAFDGLILNVD